MELISNYNLTLKQLLRKRDYIKGLIDLGYNLKKEYENVKIAIENKTHERLI